MNDCKTGDTEEKVDTRDDEVITPFIKKPDARKVGKYTPLHWASYKGHIKVVWILLKKGISVVPGSAYGETVDRFIRISIGTESEERIDYALQTLYDVLSSKPVDSEWIRFEMQDLGLAEFSPGLS